jgi:hypothetical protein
LGHVPEISNTLIEPPSVAVAGALWKFTGLNNNNNNNLLYVHQIHKWLEAHWI